MPSASSEVIWLCQLPRELAVPIIGPTPLNAVNTSAIQIANNPLFHEKTKHIEVNSHFIWQQVLTSLIKLSHVSSQDQLADILTKSLLRPRHDVLAEKLLLQPASI